MKSSHYLEYDLTLFLAFKNRKCHGFQRSTKPPFLAISSCLLKKKKKINITIYYECICITCWFPYGFQNWHMKHKILTQFKTMWNPVKTGRKKSSICWGSTTRVSGWHAMSLALLFSFNHSSNSTVGRILTPMLQMRLREIKLLAQSKIQKWLTQHIHVDLTEQKPMTFP